MNEWKAKVDALRAQRETNKTGSTASPSAAARPGMPARSGTFSGSTSPALVPAASAARPSSTAGGEAVCEGGHPMTGTAMFCTTCGSRRAAAASSPSTTASTTPASTPRPAVSTTSFASRTTSPSTIPSTPTATPTSLSTATPTSPSTATPTSSPSGGSALDRFRRAGTTDAVTRSGSAPSLISTPSASPSTTTASSPLSSSSSTSSVPTLSGTPQQQLEELQRLYAAKSAECDQLKNKLMAGLPSVTGAGSAASSGGSATALLEAKVKSLETKIASEIRQRELAEKRYEATRQELDDMKKRREAARQRMQSQASTDASAAKARNAVSAGRGAAPSPGAAAAPGTAGARVPSKRSTRVVSSAPKGPAVGDIVNRILTEMARVEAAIKKADEDRLNAENELLEVACFKQAAEDRFNELTGIVEQIAVLINNLQILIVTKCAAAPDVKASLQDIHGKLDTLATRAGQLAKGAATSSHAAVTDFANKVGAPPPPPPPLPGMPAFSSSPAASSGGGGGGGPRASTLLSQIRKGATLKTLDAVAIKKEREEKAKQHRQSVTMLSALQDTLRTALATRQDSMNPDNSDEEAWGEY